MELSSMGPELPQVENLVLPELEIGSQGLRKQILKRGTSWQTPFPGDEVEVHFSGHVEGGTFLDTSREKGTPFRFKLGQGEVIKGWDEGVATMKKGERAMFTVPPDLAYGEAGSPPNIPPNATIVFDIEMLSWRSIRDLTGDGGILKKLIAEGQGWATPRDRDEVLVKYETRLENGKLVSKSDDGVEFIVSNDYHCPALSKAVKTMRKGEKAELAVKFSYGFNPNGNGADNIDRTVPPDSNLRIQLELLSWRSVIDVTGDGKVLKKIVKAGEGFDRPNEGSKAKVIYIGKLGDGTVLERKGCSEEPFEFTTMEEQVHMGLDRAIMTMKKGEHAIVTVTADYLDGNSLSGLIPANAAALQYEIELIDFIKEKPFWKMDAEEKLEACERKKLEGNVLFKDGKFSRASKKYEKAVKYIEFDHSFTNDQQSQARGLRVSCHLNNAACKLKHREYPEAAALCTKASLVQQLKLLDCIEGFSVLELDPSNVKALFRRSQAYIKTCELEEAEADIKRALAIDPNNRDVVLAFKELRDKQREYAKQQAKLFSTILSKMG